MARYQGKLIPDDKKPTTGLAHKSLVMEANGWTFGVRVELIFDKALILDKAHIYLTSGSSKSGRETYLGVFNKEVL